jgi:hypothetical protein
MADNSSQSMATIGINDIKTLLILLSSPDQAITLTSLESLTKHAEVSSKNRNSLLNAGITPILFSLIKKSEGTALLPIRKASIACFAATSEVSEAHSDMKLRVPVIEGLVMLLEGKDESIEVKDEAAFALSNCAKDCKSID